MLAEPQQARAAQHLPEPVARFRLPVVLVEDGLSPHNRISASYLTVVNPNGRNDVPWVAPDTWLPADAWQDHPLRAVQVDRQRLEQGGRDTSKILAIIGLPQTVREQLQRCHADPEFEPARAMYFRQTAMGSDMLAAVDTYTRSLLVGEAFDAKGVAQVEPGLVAASINPQTRQRVGLHIDSWDGQTIGRRHSVRMRISWNVGREARYLLLAAVCADDVAEFLRHFGRHEALLPRDAKAFMFNQIRRGGRIPVFRIRLEPGEGYMVSTDFWAHDATTQPMKQTDLRIPYLGQFKAPHACSTWSF